MPDNPTPEMLKKMKMDTMSQPVPPVPSSSSSPTNGSAQGTSRRATVEDVDDEDVDMERGFAPGGDADYFAEEDDEGRFFGGGLTSEQKEILNIFDNVGGEGVQDDVRSRFWHMDNLMVY